MGVHRQAVAVCRGTAQPGNLRNEGGDGVFEFPTMDQSRTNKKRVPTAPVPGQGVVPLSAPKLRKENLCSTIFFNIFSLLSDLEYFRISESEDASGGPRKRCSPWDWPDRKLKHSIPT